MNTNEPIAKDNKPENQKPHKNEVGVITLKQPNIMDIEDDDDDISPISRVVGVFNSVDLNSPEAAQNVHSISDSNGGRIELIQDKIIKKLLYY